MRSICLSFIAVILPALNCVAADNVAIDVLGNDTVGTDVLAADTTRTEVVGSGKNAKTITQQESRIIPYLMLDSEFVGSGDFVKGGNSSTWENRFQMGILKPLNNLQWPNLDGQWRLRLGAEWHRFDFNHDTSLPVPNTLQSVAAVIGLEYVLDRQRVIILEAKPGFYFEQDIYAGTFNVPIKLGAAYKITDTFALVAAVSYDGFRSYPIIPGIGFVWQVTPTLTFKMVPPDPKIEWQVNDNTILWLGGELAGGAYRTDQDRDGELREAAITYTDYRVAVGATWRANDIWTLETAVGASLYRKWDYHRAEEGYKIDEAAPYVKLSLRAVF